MSLDHVQVHLVHTADEAAEFSRWLSTATSIAVDTETTGLDSYKDRVRIVQVGDGDTAWCLPVELPRSWAGLAVEKISSFKGDVIMHHAKFDVGMLRETLGLEFDATRLHDTMLLSRVLEPTRSAGLKNLAARYVDDRARVMDHQLNEALKGGGHTWETVPLDFETYWFYAGLDVVMTHRLFGELYPRVQAECPNAYQLELAASLVCGRMERHGAKIDVEFAADKRDKLDGYVRDCERWCVEQYGVKPGSNAAVIEVLKAAGHEFVKLTASGALSLDKEVLSEVDHPLAHTVLRRRQAQKIVSAYLRHFVTDVDADHRIHPRINTCEAKTSRMSMDHPNLQNLPRQSDTNRMAELVRGCVVPDEGHTLLMCDFDQVEWRLFASVSQDADLAAAFQADDFFTEMCRQVFADESIQKSDPRRQVTKNAMYARIYGAGTEKFAWTAGISLDEARQFNALLDQKYPAIRSLQQRVDQAARQRLDTEGVAYVTSPMTRRRFIIDDDATYKLVNYLFQGTAAEVLKMKLVELSLAGLENYLVCPVHDEVILEVPNDELEDVARTVHSVMNDANLFAVPITAGLAVGERWSEKRDYEV